MTQSKTPCASGSAGLESVLNEFDSQWQAGKVPDIEHYLPSAAEPTATTAEWIGELVMIDLEYRWRRAGDLLEISGTPEGAGVKPLVRPFVEDYLARFPQLKSDPTILHPLVGQEYRVRHLWGDRPAHTLMQERFPDLGRWLTDQLDSLDEELRLEQPEPAERSTASKAIDGTLGIRSSNHKTAPVADPPDLSGSIGRYSIITKLGHGAMGDVYLAYDSKLERQVALKTPRVDPNSKQELIERFHREAKAAAQLHHPNICPVYDVGEIDGRLYLTMGYVEGETLSKHIEAAGHSSPTWIAKVICGIASALAESHRIGVIHRDLKPGNVMMDSNGQPVVMDFGLATRDVSGEEVRLTATDAILGTPAYMSPEQIDKERGEIGPATDIYSLGVILFEMLTGQLPFQGSLVSVLRQIPDKQPPRPSEIDADVDEQLEALCLRMMAKNPADRPQSMDEVVAAIDQMNVDRDAAQVASESTKAAVKRSKPTRIRRGLAIATAALLVGIAAWAATLIFKTPGGTVEIELGEGVAQDIQIEIKSIAGNRVLIADASKNWQIRTPQGEYDVQIRGGIDHLEVTPQRLTVKEDESEIVHVTRKPPPKPPKPPGLLVITEIPEALPSEGEARGMARVASRGAMNHADLKPGEELADNLLGMNFCWCPPGNFLMGSADDDPNRASHEEQVEVTLTKGFWMGKYEVTQGQWEKVVGSTVKDLQQGNALYGVGADIPMYFVSHDQAQLFLRLFNEKEREAGRLDKSWEYRLPTEAEWEYACRAGTETTTYFGHRLLRDEEAHFGVKARAGWSPVGKYPPNPWGLHDMLGNVLEWTGDDYQEKLPGGTDPAVLPEEDQVGGYFAVRGGGVQWKEELRSAARTRVARNQGNATTGFRVVLAQVRDDP